MSVGFFLILVPATTYLYVVYKVKHNITLPLLIYIKTLFSNVFFTTDADADLDGTGFVDFADLTLFRGSFFQAPGRSCIDLPGGCLP